MFKEKEKDKLKEIFERVYDDPDFKRKVIETPKQVFKDYGIAFDEHIDIVIIENSKQDFHLSIPIKKSAQKRELKALPKNPSIEQIARWITTQIINEAPEKAALLENPLEVLKKLNIKVPEGITLHLHQNTENTTYFILPRRVNNNEELTDLELDMISGGKYKATLGPHGKVMSENLTFNINHTIFNFGNNYGILSDN